MRQVMILKISNGFLVQAMPIFVSGIPVNNDVTPHYCKTMDEVLAHVELLFETIEKKYGVIP